MKSWLQTNIDNSGLILFRILLGVLILFESFGAILFGWVQSVFVTSKFTFNFIGFDFLQVLHGEKMYLYFSIMGFLGILIILGLFYRFAIIMFTILWTSVYLAQKEYYNNHYYFLVLVGLIMCFLPANAKVSLDSKIAPHIKAYTVPRWMPFLLILQMAILYFYATIAKLYPDWLDGTFAKILLNGITQRDELLHLFNQQWFYLFYAYAGILYDLLIVPFLFWKRTRIFGIIASFAFHLSNAFALKIGIFPFLALSFIVLFIDPEKINKLLFKSNLSSSLSQNPRVNLYKWFFIPFFIIQIILPIRHYFIKGDVLFTEEGHRLAWRMMLRERVGALKIKIVNKNTGNTFYHNMLKDLNAKQLKVVSYSPDLIWQYCQKLKQEYPFPIEIYVESFVSVNRRPFNRMINEKVNMAVAKFDYFFHNDWILLQDLE